MTPEEREKLAGLRVLWVSHDYGYGGDLMYFGEIFRQLRELIPNTTVAIDSATRYRNPYHIDLRPMTRMKRRPIMRLGAGGQGYDTEIVVPGPLLLPRLLWSKVDVLVAIEFTLPALMAILAAAFSPRKRLVLLVESDPAARGGSTNPIVRAVKRWAVRRADVIQTNNDKGRRYLVDDLRAHPARVRVAPYLTSRPPGPEADIVARPGPLHILFANSMTPRKGLRELIAALAMLDPLTRAKVAFTFVGEGPERARAERDAADLVMGDRLRFVGRKLYGELGQHYSGAEVLAIPSLADYRSLAGFEGLAYGLALLSSMHDGATEETVIDGLNGYVIDPHDPAMVADRIARLANDRDLVLRMRRESQARYDKLFSLAVIARNLARSILRAASRV